jgi:hypothetical protein
VVCRLGWETNGKATVQQVVAEQTFREKSTKLYSEVEKEQ